MEEMPSAVAVTFSLGNSMCDNSGIATHVEITRIKLVTDPVSLLSDPIKVVSEESVSGGINGCNEAKTEVNFSTISVTKDGCVGGSDLLMVLPENGNSSIPSDDIMQDSGDDKVPSVVEDSNGIITEDLVVLKAGTEISLPNSVEIESSQIIAKSIIVESLDEVQLPMTKLLIAAVNTNAEISHGSDLKASAVVLKLPAENCLGGGAAQSVFELDCIPLWGCVSICGRRPEMEDAVTAIPRFAKIPIKMLTGDRVLDGINENLIHRTSHFYGVYDGHGGAQVANYCRDRIHLALAEEIGKLKDNLRDGITWGNQQLQWEKTFTSCFHKVDDEIGGKCSGAILEGRGSDETTEPIAPETVGSTAVVALVCSSHIIVANCGDSRAVLFRGKESMALSIDHKPNREDEYVRIEASGGKVIQWNGHRVFGVLAMSRSIGMGTSYFACMSFLQKLKEFSNLLNSIVDTYTDVILLKKLECTVNRSKQHNTVCAVLKFIHLFPYLTSKILYSIVGRIWNLFQEQTSINSLIQHR
uniref:protein-serine/threonine phosphatase n=1 Tax=Rhizophora mucronata TaxID=61149 RepID=A0A2P2JQZ1_RHIMU